MMWQAQLLVDNMEEALLKARQKLRFPEHIWNWYIAHSLQWSYLKR